MVFINVKQCEALTLSPLSLGERAGVRETGVASFMVRGGNAPCPLATKPGAGMSETVALPAIPTHRYRAPSSNPIVE